MSSVFLNVVAIAFMIAVVFVLCAGLWNLMRGGSPNRSNRLMQMRILFQFIAVVLVLGAFYLRHGF